MLILMLLPVPTTRKLLHTTDKNLKLTDLLNLTLLPQVNMLITVAVITPMNQGTMKSTSTMTSQIISIITYMKMKLTITNMNSLIMDSMINMMSSPFIITSMPFTTLLNLKSMIELIKKSLMKMISGSTCISDQVTMTVRKRHLLSMFIELRSIYSLKILTS